MVTIGKVDMIVCGAGTGGTVCGIGRKVKEVAPNCKVCILCFILMNFSSS